MDAQRLNDVDGGRGGVGKHPVSGACDLTFAHFEWLAGTGQATDRLVNGADIDP